MTPTSCTEGSLVQYTTAEFLKKEVDRKSVSTRKNEAVTA
ncbi:MAG: hypothetical protein Kow0089_23540 [Desulfobulbaceae bacterium]